MIFLQTSYKSIYMILSFLERAETEIHGKLLDEYLRGAYLATRRQLLNQPAEAVTAGDQALQDLHATLHLWKLYDQCKILCD